MRKLLMALVALSTLALLVQAQAFRRANVRADSSMTVTSTDQAALQLIAGTGSANPANTAYYSAGSLILDFTRGSNPAVQYAFATPEAGMAASKYRYRGLFQVRNNKNVAKCVWVYVPGGGVVGLEGIYLRATTDLAGNGTRVAENGGGRSPGCFSIPANQTYNVDFWWEITSGPAGPAFNVRVEAQ